jgi:TonB-dependent SusC/RagA subfamily outer membrane receptor
MPQPRVPSVRATSRASAMMLAAAVAALLMLLPLAPAAAQSATVSGTVTDSSTRQPVADALVRVEGTDLATHTDVRGRFALTGITGPTATLSVARLGYRPMTVSVTAGQQDVAIVLGVRALKLDAVVVTGQAGDTRKRALGNVVGEVDMPTAQLLTPSAGVQEALSTEVPGLQIQRASGQLGTGAVTRIRGVSSLSLASEPIIFIDGVRADNTSGSQSVAFNGGGDRPSRINDLDPDDIESIQVLKGPSAATLYGTEAANGVIQIVTKRGVAGKPSWSTELRAGANWLPSPEKLYSGIYFKDPDGNIQHLNLIENDIARGFGSPFSTGKPLGGTLSLSGGTQAIHYFFSGGYDRDQGIVDYNWSHKLNGIANLSYSASDKLRVDLNMGYTRSRLRAASATQPMTTFLVWACPNSSCIDGTGLGANDDGRGYLGGTTPQAFEDVEGFDDIDRSRLGFTVTHTPTTWLNHRLTLGGDFTGNASSLYFPLGSSASFGFPEGLKLASEDHSSFVTADYSATGSFKLTSSISSATSAGVQYYQKTFTQLQAQGQSFPIRGVNSVSGGGIRQGFEDPNFNLQNKTLGTYVQEQLGWNDSFFLTGAVRGDDNSAFGVNYKFVVYPKVSAAWVLSDAPFFHSSALLSTMKLRAAWGSSGQQPNTFAAVQTFGPSVGQNGFPTVTPLNVGNPNLKPEVTREIEAGFDASVLRDHLTIEATYYNKRTTDGILSALSSPSIGFPGNVFINIGQFSNRGFELALNSSPIAVGNFKLHLRGSLATNKNRIDVLGQDAPIPNTSIGQSVGAYNVQGFPVGSFFYQKIVSATLVAPGQVTDVMCAGGTNFGRGDGTVVPCANAPFVYSGSPTPTWLSALNADVTWRRFTLAAVAEFQGGNWYSDGNLGGADVFFNDSRAAVEQTDPVLVAMQNAVQFGQAGFMKAGFGKIRNISLTYDAPNSVAGRLGASRASVTLTLANVATIWRAQQGTFGAKAIDPEVRTNTASTTGYIVDQNLTNGFTQESWPQFRRFLATVRLSY